MSKAYHSPYVHAGHLWLLGASDIRVSCSSFREGSVIMSQLCGNMLLAPFYSSPFLFLYDSSLVEQPTYF